MTYFVKKGVIVIEAHQWFKNGDHPKDDVMRPFEDSGVIPSEPREGKIVRYFRHPEVDGKTICEQCGHSMHDHGFIDVPKNGGYTVHPGDYIITERPGSGAGNFSGCHADLFEMTFEPIEI